MFRGGKINEINKIEKKNENNGLFNNVFEKIDKLGKKCNAIESDIDKDKKNEKEEKEEKVEYLLDDPMDGLKQGDTVEFDPLDDIIDKEIAEKEAQRKSKEKLTPFQECQKYIKENEGKRRIQVMKNVANGESKGEHILIGQEGVIIKDTNDDSLSTLMQELNNEMKTLAQCEKDKTYTFDDHCFKQLEKVFTLMNTLLDMDKTKKSPEFEGVYKSLYKTCSEIILRLK